MLSRLKAFADNPWVNLVAGTILLASSVAEIVDRAGDDKFHIGHGLLIFSIVQVLHVLPDILEGAEKLLKLEDQD